MGCHCRYTSDAMGFNDLELRLRLTRNVGDALSEYGEKPTRYKWELRLRYYF